MTSTRLPPDEPQEWLNRAKSNLAKAKGGISIPGVYLEDLCFDAQQAAEKAVKALLIHLRVRFPYVHDIAELLTLVERAGQVVSMQTRQAIKLTRYAIATRYPGTSEPVTPQEYDEAVAMAGGVVYWVEEILEKEPNKKV